MSDKKDLLAEGLAFLNNLYKTGTIHEKALVFVAIEAAAKGELLTPKEQNRRAAELENNPNIKW